MIEASLDRVTPEKLPTIDVGPVAVPLDLRLHAVERWQQRVDRSLTTEQAAEQLLAFVTGAHVRGRGPKWLLNRSALRGARFLVNATQPDIVALVAPSSRVDGVLAVITVYQRDRVNPSTEMLRLRARADRHAIRRKRENRKSYSRRST